MKYILSFGAALLILLAAGAVQQTAFSQPGNAPAPAPGFAQGNAVGPPDAFAPPRTDNPRANERSRPGGPRVGDGQQMIVIPGHGVVISPS